MKVKKSTIVYGIICDLPVCIALCLASNVIAIASVSNGHLSFAWNNFNWIGLTYNLPIAFILAMLISCFVPLVRIGKWFTGLFKIEHETFKGNLPYRFLAMLSSSLIFFIGTIPVIYPSARNVLDSVLLNKE